MEVIPLFRTDAQAKILAVLFERRGVSRPIGHVARRAGVPLSTASREVDRLVDMGLVTVEKAGRMRILTANWDIPWAEELASILAQTVGLKARIARAMSTVDGIEEAYLFGSWLDEANRAPNDVDVVVVGTPDRGLLRDALRPLEDAIHLYINPVIVTRTEWEQDDDTFLATVWERGLDRLDLDVGRHDAED